MDSRIQGIREQLLELANELVDSSLHLRRLISDDRGPVTVWRDPDFPPEDTHTLSCDRIYAAWAATECKYHHDDQLAHDTICAPGFVTVSAQTIGFAKEVNEVAERFKEAGSEARKFLRGRKEDTHLAETWLREHGHSRIHRRQAYRQLLIIESPVERMSFSWQQLPKIFRLKRQKLIELLGRRLPDEDYLGAKKILSSIPDEKFALIEKPAKPHPRVQIKYIEHRASGQKAGWKMYARATPILVSNEITEPQISVIQKERAVKESIRDRSMHRSIAREAIIENPSIHRYLPTNAGGGHATPPAQYAQFTI
jgi:hypothetical protein